jgi:peptidoglycan L-alanyl-D-glutamate endopeptidase CwlK
MGYRLSQRSLDRMEGVHNDLQDVVCRAIEITEVDFAVIEGLRSESRQWQLVDSGASQTMNSRHLNGYAVDLAAWVDGEIRWDWPLYYKIAEAVQEAAKELGVTVTWGGCWENLNEVGDPKKAMQAYVARKQAAGEKAFPDGPHFQLSWSEYPA